MARAFRLYLVATILFVIGIFLVGQQWKGDAGLTFGYPLSSCSVHLNGAATGGVALAGTLVVLISLILAAIAFCLGVVGIFRREKVMAEKQSELSHEESGPSAE